MPCGAIKVIKKPRRINYWVSEKKARNDAGFFVPENLIQRVLREGSNYLRAT